ncbi:hypothetical protein [Leeuwenhoekiella sp. MAR_2009_132]|uniref:hypothetical protein n=1 Tax=Leeuwenhoekiella sp. MAR_2009_132 TaxID=1392489 RepID=UPI00048BD874|nr:hypothetical protein [Leeuwenhoekiella sp. MAR_2009_132]
MRKFIILSAFAATLFVSCDDTRKVLHEQYLEYVMHTDSLDVVHDAMTVHHDALKTDTRTLAQKLKDVEETDSIAIADLAKHQVLLKEQATSLSKLKKLIESHADVKSYFMSDSISVEQMEAQLVEMEANNTDIAARLTQIKTELKMIEAEQESLKKTEKH